MFVTVKDKIHEILAQFMCSLNFTYETSVRHLPKHQNLNTVVFSGFINYWNKHRSSLNTMRDFLFQFCMMSFTPTLVSVPNGIESWLS